MRVVPKPRKLSAARKAAHAARTKTNAIREKLIDVADDRNSLQQKLAKRNATIADLQALAQEQKLTIQALMSGMPEGSTTTPVIRQIADLQERLEAAEKDAARYRWLRNKSTGPAAIWELVSDEHNPPYWTLKCEEELDADIDAALSKKGTV